jgi:hypothetical protein
MSEETGFLRPSGVIDTPIVSLRFAASPSATAEITLSTGFHVYQRDAAKQRRFEAYLRLAAAEDSATSPSSTIASLYAALDALYMQDNVDFLARQLERREFESVRFDLERQRERMAALPAVPDKMRVFQGEGAKEVQPAAPAESEASRSYPRRVTLSWNPDQSLLPLLTSSMTGEKDVA